LAARQGAQSVTNAAVVW